MSKLYPDQGVGPGADTMGADTMGADAGVPIIDEVD